ncbi:uncharacterized protein LOC143960058 isoform X2 [Lithobates pipiens]
MILLRFSVLFLLCGIICCQESVNTSPTGETAKQDQESLPPTTISENAPRENEAEKSGHSDEVTEVDPRESQTKLAASPDNPEFIARRRKCCEDGRQHFYANGNCANRPQKENEAVGLWCDRKFLECCSFMEAYYMGPADGCRNKQPSCRLPSTENVAEELPKENEADKLNVTAENSESQTTPDDTPATGGDTVTVNATTPTHILQFIARRRKCCEDGRQHFYTNGNCANRLQKENEAVGLWCDRKFLECCSFMEAYYMGPVDGCRNKQPSCRLPSTENAAEELPKENEADKLNVTAENSESQTTPDDTPAKRKKCCEDGRQHFYTNGNCANRPQKENEAVGLWCDRKFLQCCSFMEAYYMGPVDGCRNKQCNSQLPSPTDTPHVTNRPLH